MKLENLSQVEKLAKFHSSKFLTTSFYLDRDKSRLTKKVIGLALKNILHQGRQRIQEANLSKAVQESLSADLDKIKAYCTQHILGSSLPGLAVFSCQGEGFWQDFDLGSAPRSRLLFDHNPYVKPLSAVLDESLRLCALLVDRRKASWFSVHLGEARLLDQLQSDVPSKVKKGGFEGTESKRIERHVEAHLLEHFKKVARSTFDLFQAHNFDFLLLGCAEENRTELEYHLHPYLKNKIRNGLKLRPDASPDQVLQESNKLEKMLKKREEDSLLLKFVSELEKGGLAVSGLRNSLRSLNSGEALVLLVSRDYSSPGRLCPRCRLLYIEEKTCPGCQKPTEAVVDILDEAVELALDKKSGVKHISPSSRLDHYGKVGALLRYKA
jgi:peptide subunit release factor 1 (eRF1)